MNRWADIDDPSFFWFLERIEKVVGEIERTKVIDGVGHLNSQFAEGLFIQHHSSIVDEDIHSLEIPLK